MSARIRTDDICVGDSTWIKFIDLNGRYDEAVNVDHLLPGLLPLWQSLEQHCVSECCGFHAFDFTPEAIRIAVIQLDAETLHDSLAQAILAIRELQTTVVCSTRLNNLADKQTFLELLSHVKACIPLTS